MALPQNLGCPCSCKTEGKRLLKWLQTEGSKNEGIVAELLRMSSGSGRLVSADRSFYRPLPVLQELFT